MSFLILLLIPIGLCGGHPLCDAAQEKERSLLQATALPATPLDPKEALLVRRIIEYWKEGDFVAVKGQIADFLHKYPHSSQKDPLLAMLGDLYTREEAFAEAIIAYEQIQSSEVRRQSLFSYLCCLFAQKDYEQTIRLGEEWLEGRRGTKPQFAAIHFQLASSYYEQSKQQQAPDPFLKKAQEHYLAARHTAYDTDCLLPLAKIYTHFQQYTLSAPLYLTLSKVFPHEQEAFLFEAASLQLHFDRNLASETFAKVYALGGKLAAPAAFNQLHLLFQEKRYRDLLLAHERALAHITFHKRPVVHYYVGMSLLELGDYVRACDHLKRFVQGSDSSQDILKNTLLSLCVCAEKLGNRELFDEVLHDLKALFPQDDVLAQAELSHALLCKKQGLLDRTQADFEHLLQTFTTHPQKEGILYDYSLLLFETQQWEKSTLSWGHFLQEFPTSSKAPSAYRYQVLSLVEEIKHSSAETLCIKQNDLVQILRLANHYSLQKKERKQLLYLAGKTEYDLRHYDDAIALLSEYVETYPQDAKCKLAHMLIAYSHLLGSQDPLLFSLYAEKALAVSAPIEEKELLHLQLYNAYLDLAKRGAPDQKQQWVDKAAEHLFLGMNRSSKKENLLWLAHYYFQRLEKEGASSPFLDRSTLITEKLLGSLDLSEITKESLEREGLALRLANLYTMAGKPSHARALLEQLKELQDLHPDWEWKYARLTLFELGKLYEMTHQPERAFEAYDFLIHTATRGLSYFAKAAQLHKAKLQYARLQTPEVHSLVVQAILDQLKDLFIQRKLLSEPLHLEAALSYIDIKAALAHAEDKLPTRLRLIQQLKQDLSNKEDPLVQQYEAAQSEMPEQWEIFQSYMRFLNLEEARIQKLLGIQPSTDNSNIEDLSSHQLHPLLQERLPLRNHP